VDACHWCGSQFIHFGMMDILTGILSFDSQPPDLTSTEIYNT
jgi:hypothetical protein